MEDQQIIELYFARDEEAIAATKDKYGPYCAAVAGNILDTPEDVEEVLSDTWLRIWNSIPPQHPESLKLYIARIARNLSFDRFRSLSREKRGGSQIILALEELSEYLSDGNTPEAAIEMDELTQILNEFLRKLPKEERQVFVCRYWYLDPIADIAKRFGFTQSKVKSMLARTRMKLRATLTKEGIAL